MALSITQDTFDATVKENMEEFDMSVQDAIEDTIKQYQAQGVDLSHIIVDLMAGASDCVKLKEAINSLKACENVDPIKFADIIPLLHTISSECKRGISYQVLAGKAGLYGILLKILKHANLEEDILKECLITMTDLMTKQPDILTEEGILCMVNILDTCKNQDILQALIIWIRECCILHEYNRQNIFQAGVFDHLKPLLTSASPELLCAVLGLLRAFVLDDDIRVEFGKAHEHARIIATDTLTLITTLLQKHVKSPIIMSEVLITLSALMVRAEFCKKVDEANGLVIIKTAMEEFGNNEKLVRQCFKVLKSMAGNDECKAKIIHMGFAPLLISVLNNTKTVATTTALGLGCIASLTLRSPNNSEALYEAGAPTAIVECMKMHPENESVQKNAAWAIRNMVSRSRHQNKEFLRLSVESYLKIALTNFKKSEYDIKAALRDLECDVVLKEEWTGTGGKISSESMKEN